MPWTHWLHLLRPQCKLRHASVYIVCRTSSCCGSHFVRFYSACRTRSCGGASAYGVCFSSSCSVCNISSCGRVHRSSTSGKLRSASAYNRVPFAEHISPAPVGYAARVPVVECTTPALTPVPVAEHSSPAPAGYAARVPVVQYHGGQNDYI